MTKQPKTDSTATVLPGAVLVGDVTVDAEASIWYNAVLRGDEAPITVGRRTNIQDGSILHGDDGYPVVLGDDVTVGHACILHGCTVGNGVLVGMGSVVMNGAVLEDGVVLGAGSLVTEGTVIPAGMLAFGRPAKPVRPLTDEEKAQTLRHAAHYVALAQSR